MGRIELDDFTIVWQEYYPINGNELLPNPATPYFIGNFRDDVILNWNESSPFPTTLKFKVGGSSKKEIWGRVTPPVTTPASKRTFCIKERGQASGKAAIECKVVINRPNADHVGDWNLTIWYTGNPDDKASSVRTVINNSICGGWSCSVQ